MTEDQARKAKRLIDEFDHFKNLPDSIRAKYKKAKDGDAEALDKIANVAIELSEEVARYIGREIAAL
jgi:hypothetical protein